MALFRSPAYASVRSANSRRPRHPRGWFWARPPKFTPLSLLDMSPIVLTEFLVIFGQIENIMCQCSSEENAHKLAEVIPPGLFDIHRRRIRRLKERCKEIGLTTSTQLITDTLLRYMPDNTPTQYGELRKSLDTIVRAIYAELATVVVVHLPQDQAALYEKDNLFGEAVTDKFKDAAQDIHEAGSCYALDRHTACVMHLMRALEVALDGVGRGIGLGGVVMDAKHSWGTALKKIGDQIGANDKTPPDPDWTGAKSDFFKDARALLFAVKVAWRDNSMHLEKVYSPQHSKRIFDTVKNLFEYLADHLDQSGQYVP
jgi:hypothetical protein